jgi:hypothetical protein
MFRFLLFSFLIFTALACRKDAGDYTDITTKYTPPALKVNGSVTGQILDEAGIPLEDIVVTIGSSTTTSGAKGYFMFQNIVLDANGTSINVNHPGYFRAATRIYPQANRTSYAVIQLVEKSVVGSFNTSNGGLVELNDQASIDFPPNAVARLNGSPYSGQVEVAARWVHSAMDGFHHMTPGNYFGVNHDNNVVSLASFGYMAVQMHTPQGEILQIAENNTVEIFFPVPESHQSSMKPEISLWHFDQENGFWREDGVAYREGNGYLGIVSHFSFWSPDQPFDLVDIEGTVLSVNGDTLANVPVSVFSSELGETAFAYTNSSGVFSGKVPANQLLQLQVINQCGGFMLSVNIGPFNTATDLGNITVNDPSVQLTEVSGTLVDCDNNPIGLGVVVVCWSDGCTFIATNSEGTFSQTVSYCNASSLTVQALDYSTGLLSETISYAASEVLNLQDFEVCDQPLTEYISLVFNGQEKFYPNAQYSVQGIMNRIRSQGSMHNLEIAFLNLDSMEVGIYDGTNIVFNFFEYTSTPDIPLFLTAGACPETPCDILVVITEVGPVGGLIKGSYTANIDFATSTQEFPNAPISGSFSALRIN